MKKKDQEQLSVVKLLAQGISQREAARTVGIRPETISRWKRDSRFLVLVKMVKEDPNVITHALTLLDEEFEIAACRMLNHKIDMILLDRLSTGEIDFKNLSTNILIALKEVFRDLKHHIESTALINRDHLKEICSLDEVEESNV